jgi:hypothetical protein
MRLASLPPSLAVFAVTLLGLTACLGSDPTLVPDPEPTTTPVFASDEEALAAAEEAYAAYFEVSDAILNEGGIGPERLQVVASSSMYQIQLAGYNQAREGGLRSIGFTVVDSVGLQHYDTMSVDGKGIVTVYACIDVSSVDLVDATGASVVSPLRPNRTSVEATFDIDPESPNRIVLSAEEPWDGSSVCVP